MSCTHLAEFRTVKPSADGCEECLKLGQDWIHLRICRVCGHVGCCDQSVGKHAQRDRLRALNRFFARLTVR